MQQRNTFLKESDIEKQNMNTSCKWDLLKLAAKEKIRTKTSKCMYDKCMGKYSDFNLYFYPVMVCLLPKTAQC